MDYKKLAAYLVSTYSGSPLFFTDASMSVLANKYITYTARDIEEDFLIELKKAMDLEGFSLSHHEGTLTGYLVEKISAIEEYDLLDADSIDKVLKQVDATNAIMGKIIQSVKPDRLMFFASAALAKRTCPKAVVRKILKYDPSLLHNGSYVAFAFASDYKFYKARKVVR